MEAELQVEASSLREELRERKYQVRAIYLMTKISGGGEVNLKPHWLSSMLGGEISGAGGGVWGEAGAGGGRSRCGEKLFKNL